MATLTNSLAVNFQYKLSPCSEIGIIRTDLLQARKFVRCLTGSLYIVTLRSSESKGLGLTDRL